MHEYSIVSALLRQVGRAAAAQGAGRVCRVSLRIGELAGIEPALLMTAFEQARVHTIASDAILDVEWVPVTWACRRCETVIPEGEILTCPTCSTPARLVSGGELMLQQLEMEVANV